MDSIKVSDYMDRQPVLLRPEMSLATAVDELLDNHKLGAAVIDHNQHIVGFLTQQDCLAVMLESSYHCDLISTVEDCMRTDVLIMTPNTSILAVAEEMKGMKPKVYPVVENNRVLGTINRTHVLKAINTYMQQCYLTPV
ncbi:CBS domain-containing protein [Shewanella surugensis]|uniref:CBS domain-containing protein n=1 Tax=Shewanella surugensis TaxID=212020 RepID=A0ABT0L7L9_9GAMM|nr:CBS domain-containing protein [Shewanella surugensis]MCL1123372.1 CBS domain-containing protein [Shewanella surugensis]